MIIDIVSRNLMSRRLFEIGSVPLLNGVSGMPAAKYSRYDLIACSIWTFGLGVLVVGFGGLFS